MEEYTLKQPGLYGRDEELESLKTSLEKAIAGEGSTIFIAGEAGIGKTRLMSELKIYAEEMGVDFIQGWCLAESLEPLMPIKTALREARLSHLISGDPPPLVLSAYLMNDAGMLISKVERSESDIDPDIFAGMLQAVGNFIQDSLSATMNQEKEAGLNSLGYGDYNILIQSSGNISLAIVIKGLSSEFLIGDMKGVLKKIGNKFENWDGDAASVKPIQPNISWFVDSGKYDGKFLVDDPKMKQENLFDNILLGLQRASADVPLILFLDDLQWSDSTSLNLIHYLSRNTRKCSILILGTYRPEDIAIETEGTVHRLETTLQGMNRESLYEKIDLKRLDAENTKKMLESVLEKTTFDKRFYEKIFKETEGSPFFILEVVKLLVADETIKCNENSTWQFVRNLDELEIPNKIYDVVKRRLNRLNKDQKEILECASIIGNEFESEIIGVITGYNLIQLLKNLSEIEKNHQLIHFSQDKYRFDHGKVKEVLYKGIGEELRREYHRIVGDAIFEMHEENPSMVINELAYHYYQAGNKKAKQYLIMAGDRAKDRYANEEAAQFYQKVLGFAEEANNPEIFEKIGDTQILTGDFEAAIYNLTKASDISSDKEMKARNLRKLGDVFERRGEYEAALECVRNAKEIIQYENSLEHGRTCTVEGKIKWRKGDFEGAMPLFNFALGIFKIFEGAEKDYGDTLRFVGNIHLSRAEYDEALSYYEKSLSVMEEIGDPYGTSTAMGNIGIVEYMIGDMDGALGYYRQSMEIKEKLGDKEGGARMLNSIGLTYLNKGEMDKALEYNEKSLRMQEILGDKDGISRALATMGLLYKNKGALDLSLDYFEKSLVLREKLEHKDGIGKSLNGIGCIYLIKGESQKALEYFEKSLEICREIGLKRLMIYNHCHVVEAKLELKNLNSVLEHGEMALKIAEEIGANIERGLSLRTIGMAYRELGSWEKSQENFDEALKIFQEYEDKVEKARVLYELALMWIASGESERARGHLVEASHLFDEMGMVLWEERVRKGLIGLK